MFIKRCIPVLAVIAATLLLPVARAADTEEGRTVSILAYHRFGPTVADSMTVRTAVFEQHLAWLAANGYAIAPLQAVVSRLLAGEPPADAHSVVITVDDGHRTVYSELFPLIRKYRFPVTLFIYPSAISNASYALTWDQLREMKESGLVDIQSHTLWHPNFHHEKKRLSAADYQAFVSKQLKQSKNILESRLGARIDMLAWPFGIYDQDLEKSARDAGYIAAFSIDRGPLRHGTDPLSLPRYLMEDAAQGARFEAIARGVAR